MREAFYHPLESKPKLIEQQQLHARWLETGKILKNNAFQVNMSGKILYTNLCDLFVYD